MASPSSDSMVMLELAISYLKTGGEPYLPTSSAVTLLL